MKSALKIDKNQITKVPGNRKKKKKTHLTQQSSHFFSFLPPACGSSQVSDQTCAKAATQAIAMTPEP